MMRGAIRALAAAALGAGCTLMQPAPVKRAFLLDPPLPARSEAPSRAQDAAAVLRVNRFVTAQPFDGKSFVYRLDDQRFELDYYNEFLAFPATMLTENTLRHLAAAGLFRAVVPMTSSVESRLVLEGSVTQLYGDLRASGTSSTGGASSMSGAAAVLAIRFLLAREDANARVLYDKSLSRRVPAAARSADALVAAFDRALAEILDELVRDLGAMPQP